MGATTSALAGSGALSIVVCVRLSSRFDPRIFSSANLFYLRKMVLAKKKHGPAGQAAGDDVRTSTSDV